MNLRSWFVVFVLGFLSQLVLNHTHGQSPKVIAVNQSRLNIQTVIPEFIPTDSEHGQLHVRLLTFDPTRPVKFGEEFDIQIDSLERRTLQALTTQDTLATSCHIIDIEHHKNLIDIHPKPMNRVLFDSRQTGQAGQCVLRKIKRFENTYTFDLSVRFDVPEDALDGPFDFKVALRGLQIHTD